MRGIRTVTDVITVPIDDTLLLSPVRGVRTVTCSETTGSSSPRFSPRKGRNDIVDFTEIMDKLSAFLSP